MIEKGIYILANDAVLDQLIALLNSIEANYSAKIPVMIIPYDDNMSEVRAMSTKRSNVTIFENTDSMKKWENFAHKAWRSYNADHSKLLGRHAITVHRKLCCFDGPFEEFLFMDADTLLMNKPDVVFEKLNEYDFAVYDYQFKDPSHVYNIHSARLFEVFSEERMSSEIFCTGFFASKKGLFDERDKEIIVDKLVKGEAEILYPRSADQSLLNYMIMTCGKSSVNLALSLPSDKKTGNSATSRHFTDKEHILYDKGERLTYFHYIGVNAALIREACLGKNIEFPYRNIFLYYRFLHEPEKKPIFSGAPVASGDELSFMSRIKRIAKKLIKLR